MMIMSFFHSSRCHAEEFDSKMLGHILLHLLIITSHANLKNDSSISFLTNISIHSLTSFQRYRNSQRSSNYFPHFTTEGRSYIQLFLNGGGVNKGNIGYRKFNDILAMYIFFFSSEYAVKKYGRNLYFLFVQTRMCFFILHGDTGLFLYKA